MGVEEVIRRRAAARAARQRRRIVVVSVACAAAAALLIAGYVTLRPEPSQGQEGSAPAARATETEQAAAVATDAPQSSIETLTPAPSSTLAAPSTRAFVASKPPVVADYIPFGAGRRQQMAEYSQRRYGDSSTTLAPKVIVLHYTAGGTAQSAHDLFAANQPNGGELPGVVAHFIVDTDGTIYQELPLGTRGRHTIGLNHVAIGIEFVQDAGSGPEWADQQILYRKQQMAGGLALVAWLQERYGIEDRDIIGHASADDHRYFKDLTGMDNDHGDWLGGDVAEFRQALRELRKD